MKFTLARMLLSVTGSSKVEVENRTALAHNVVRIKGAPVGSINGRLKEHRRKNLYIISYSNDGRTSRQVSSVTVN